MINKKINVECDVDGVLADLYGSEVMRRHMYQWNRDFNESMLTEYSIDCIDDERTKIGLRLAFKNKSVIELLDPYPDADEFINALASMNEVNLIVHTLMIGEEDTVLARKKWLEQMIVRTKPFSFMIDSKSKSSICNMDIIIEDCPENLDRSSAKYKILIKHPYNITYAEANKNNANFYSVDNLRECLDLIIRIIHEIKTPAH